MPLYLKEWRDAHGLTLVQLGSRLGKHFTTIQKWESGGNAVDTNDMQRLADVYGVHPAALFFHPNEKSAAERLQKAHQILSDMTEEQAEHWLKTGKMMGGGPS